MIAADNAPVHRLHMRSRRSSRENEHCVTMVISKPLRPRRLSSLKRGRLGERTQAKTKEVGAETTVRRHEVGAMGFYLHLSVKMMSFLDQSAQESLLRIFEGVWCFEQRRVSTYVLVGCSYLQPIHFCFSVFASPGNNVHPFGVVFVPKGVHAGENSMAHGVFHDFAARPERTTKLPELSRTFHAPRPQPCSVR